MDIVPLIPLIIAIVTAAASIAAYPIQRNLENIAKRRDEKRNQYTQLLTPLVRHRAGKEGPSNLNDAIQTIYAVGSAGAVKALDSFLAAFRSEGTNKQIQDKLYAEMLSAFREDLGAKDEAIFPRQLPFTMFAPRPRRMARRRIDQPGRLGASVSSTGT